MALLLPEKFALERLYTAVWSARTNDWLSAVFRLLEALESPLCECGAVFAVEGIKKGGWTRKVAKKCPRGLG